MQVAHLDAGHTNYTQSILVSDRIYRLGPKMEPTQFLATKRIPFKLVGSGLQVTQGGSAYTMEGVAYNEAAPSIKYKDCLLMLLLQVEHLKVCCKVD